MRVKAQSNYRVWWKCPHEPDHEWEATVGQRTKRPSCPFCSGRQASARNNLAVANPDLAAQWHPTKNDELTPFDFTPNSGRKVWWVCGLGPDHEWQAEVVTRNSAGRGCPYCSGNKLSVTNSLATRFPDVARSWHPTLNGEATPEQVVSGTKQKFWWKCDVADDHEWKASASNRTANRSGCPGCSGRHASVTNSLETRFPEIAAQWHPTKNEGVTPADVVAGSSKKVWWKCPNGPDHEWQTAPSGLVTRGCSCPFCSMPPKKVSVTNCMATLRPDMVPYWHHELNGDITP